MNTNRTLRAILGSLALVGLLCAGTTSVRSQQTPKTKLSSTQAEAAALKKYKSGKVQGKTALENEDGKWEYAVMVKAGSKTHEVMVNANTGKIDSEEIVTAKEEAAEKKAEEAKKTGKKTSKMDKSGKGRESLEIGSGRKGRERVAFTPYSRRGSTVCSGGFAYF